MVTEAIMDVLFGLVEYIVGLLPTTGPPGWVSDAPATLQQVLGYGVGLGNWVPWALLGVVVPAVFAAHVIGFTITTFRVIASFFTGGGGST